mmetsp:Transcript_31561/g.43075  ORF Transcript_31561/g.43075 Transcript_31561/m.43075 type:complete len:91 (-) Transcript_31561:244-516(-)
MLGMLASGSFRPKVVTKPELKERVRPDWTILEKSMRTLLSLQKDEALKLTAQVTLLTPSTARCTAPTFLPAPWPSSDCPSQSEKKGQAQR